MTAKRELYEKLVILWLFLLSLVISLVWFSDRKLIGGGEEGIWFYEPYRNYNVFKDVWTSVGLGKVVVFTLPSLISYIQASVLGSVFPYVTVQLFIYLFLFFSGLIGFYFLSKEFLPKKIWWLPLVSSVFYLLNLYSQSQIWSRFLFSGMYAWAFLPIFLFLWLKWLIQGNFKWIIFFLAGSFFYSSAFAHPGYFFTFWIPGLIFLLTVVFNEKHNKKVLYYRALLGLILWFTVNLWWIYPAYKFSSDIPSENTDWKYNLATLQGISRDATNVDIFFLRQKFFFNRSGYWGDYYIKPYAYLVNLIIFLTAFVGLLKRKTLKYSGFVITLAFIGWLISKGTNAPFGHAFFAFIFKNFSFTSALRNSYEKFGLVWLVPYSIFFSLGLYYIYTYISPRFAKVFLWGMIFVCLGLNVWPMWGGRVFSPTAKVVIPSYYEEANSYLNSLTGDGRILVLPIIPGEGVRYKWPGGDYYGIEPSHFLFDRRSFSRIIRINDSDEKYKKLYESFSKGEGYISILDETHVQYLVFHHDLDLIDSGATGSSSNEEILRKDTNFELLRRIGKLDIYAYKENKSLIFGILGQDQPNLDYQKLNNGLYKVKVVNAQKPYTLTFKESYHPNWNARIEDEDLGTHHKAYGYANAWDIDKRGDYEIDILFEVWPWEKLF